MGTDDAAIPRLDSEPQFLRALIELTNELLSSNLDTSFYQHALDKTIALVPGAEAGSVLVRRDDGLYHFEAANGFDMNVLRDIVLSDEELDRPDTDVDVHEIDIHDFKRRVREENIPHFDRGGRVEDIKCTLSVRLKTPDEIVGYFNLDNFSTPNAFTERDRSIAQAIAGQVSTALHRLVLERRLRREREHFQHLARHDVLTDLPNRRSLFDELGRAIASGERRGARVGLIYIDLNHFKSVNDRFGHAAGDALLRCVSERISGAVRRGDLAARIGGDEFAVILTDVHSADDVRANAERITDVICREVDVSGAGAGVIPSVSTGIAVFPDDAADVDELLNTADSRMYKMKRGTEQGYARQRF